MYLVKHSNLRLYDTVKYNFHNTFTVDTTETFTPAVHIKRSLAGGGGGALPLKPQNNSTVTAAQAEKSQKSSFVNNAYESESCEGTVQWHTSPSPPCLSLS